MIRPPRKLRTRQVKVFHRLNADDKGPGIAPLGRVAGNNPGFRNRFLCREAATTFQRYRLGAAREVNASDRGSGGCVLDDILGRSGHCGLRQQRFLRIAKVDSSQLEIMLEDLHVLDDATEALCPTANGH